MTTVRVALSLLLAIALGCLCAAQSEPEIRTLKRDTEVVVEDEFAVPILAPIRCSPDGDVYFRAFHQAAPMGAPVTRLSADGKRKAMYQINEIPKLGAGEAVDFGVIPGGGLVALLELSKKGETVLAFFSSDGTFRTAASLREHIVPERIAAFSENLFLVTGHKAAPDGTPTDEPLARLFDSNGIPVGGVSLTKEETGAVYPRDEETKPAASDFVAQQAIFALPMNTSDGRGHVFISKQSPNPVIIRINSDGTHRSFVVTPPIKGYRAMDLRYVDGQLALDFEEPVTEANKGQPGDQIFRLVDSETGELIADFRPEPGLGNLSCMTRTEFVFLGHKQGKLTLVHAPKR